MIIGFPDIRRYNMTRLCRQYFMNDEVTPDRSLLTPERDIVALAGNMIKHHTNDYSNLPFLVQQRNENVGLLLHRDELLNMSEGIPDDAGEVFWKDDIMSTLDFPAVKEFSNKSSNRPRYNHGRVMHPAASKIKEADVLTSLFMNESALELPTIVGNDPIHQKARKIVEEHGDVFRRKVNLEPASVRPMELRLHDESKWRVKSNSLAPRVQSLLKEEALRETIDTLLASGVISESQATHYSQVLLVPKPGAVQKWRLCIDYRPLNELLEGMGWPIPNIKQLLHRIGRRGAKYFAVLDLTSGYHQVLLSQNSRDFAAFITPFGTFVPNRISMGLKSAPSYFQQQLQTDVLGGLMYEICELYIDDIIVFGRTEEEFLTNLTTVLKRLRERGISLNPDKAKIAVMEVEAVGHVIDQYGITMSEEKINKVMDFPLPKVGKQLKQFLGLANYFRDHIQNYSSLSHPLDKLVCNYKDAKNREVRWTAETTVAFQSIQQAIGKCPKLFFMSHQAPIYLETDASGYGIGAYLYQVIEGEQQTIAFMSKSLNRAQLNWTTIEQECFAIYAALREWEYLLRDVKFIIKTDHENLRYLNSNTPKVVRWKLAIQEFNFSVEHIKGEDNIVADTLSRIVREDTIQLHTSEIVSIHDDDEDSTTEDFKYPTTLLADDYIAYIASEPSELMLNAINGRHPLRPAAHHDVPQQAGHAITERILRVHNSLRGHHGFERTLEIVKREQGSWKYMRQHIKDFIEHCPLCQKLKDIKSVIISTPFTTATYFPMSRINMDTIGPLPKDESGNEYILVMIDCFSRFVELYAIPSTEARPCAKCLIDFFGRYGAPQYILSDRGSQFVNETINELLAIVGSQKLLSLAYSKQENAIVERANKEVMRHLRAIVFDTRLKNEWSLVLPLVQRIMNASTHESIGVSPAQLVFGNAIQLDRGLFFQQDNDPLKIPTTTPSVKQYIDALMAQQVLVLRIAQETQMKKDSLTLANAATKGNKTEFPINSFVLLRYPAGLGDSHRPPSKLHTRWQGPFKVSSFKGDEYVLQNLVTLRESRHHVQELAPFKWNANMVNPKEVALRDRDNFVVHQILSHTGDLKRLSTLRFKVRWEGYDAADDTYEPWKALRTNRVLHEYLRQIGKSHLIPAAFTT